MTELTERVKAATALLQLRFVRWNISVDNIDDLFTWTIYRQIPIDPKWDGICNSFSCTELQILRSDWYYQLHCYVFRLRQECVPFLLKTRERINHARS